MRVLITGGAGFIGSHLASECLQRGCHVTVLDDLSTGAETNLESIAESIDLRVGTVCDPAIVEPLVRRVDFVFHLAAAVGVELVNARPSEALTTNVLGSHVVQHAAARADVPILVASSSEVYSPRDPVPFHESLCVGAGDPAMLRTSYAGAKVIGECLATALARDRGLRAIVVRLFNVVGPRQSGRYGMVVPTFVDRALAGQPLRVFGDGSQTRCFADVRDVVACLWRIASRRCFGQVFNLGSDDERRVLDLARRITELTDSRSSIEFVPFECARRGYGPDVARRVPCLRKLKAAIGVVPMRGLDESLRAVIEARVSAVLPALG